MLGKRSKKIKIILAFSCKWLIHELKQRKLKEKADLRL